MTKLLRSGFLILGLMSLAFSTQAALIEIVPGAQDVALGDPVQVDILFTPEGALLGGFDIDILFDDAILAFSSFDFGVGLGGGFPDSFQDFDDRIAGVLNIAELSLVSDLSGLQNGSPFLLGSIFFDTLAAGTSTIVFGEIMLTDDGLDTLPVTPINGAVTVNNPPVSVPEPSTLALILIGLFAIATTRRPRRRQVAQGCAGTA